MLRPSPNHGTQRLPNDDESISVDIRCFNIDSLSNMKATNYIVLHLYFKRGEPYLCSAKAPVLDGSGSRR